MNSGLVHQRTEKVVAQCSPKIELSPCAKTRAVEKRLPIGFRFWKGKQILKCFMMSSIFLKKLKKSVAHYCGDHLFASNSWACF